MSALPAIDPIIMARINVWLNGAYDDQTKEEIRALLKQHPEALIDAFYTDLTFGTGGLRELMGVGTNRLNSYTIQSATQGLANYLLQQKKRPLSVVVGFDCRHHSREFAEQTVRVCAANGIHAYLLKELRPTPYVSFACRYKKCDAAVMITASHNPKEYNGYKVYWNDGAQVVPPHDTGIIAEVEKIKSLSQVKCAPLTHPEIEILDETLDEAYLAAIRPLQHFPEQNRKDGASVAITYTSFCGTGFTMVPKALKDWGFSTLHYVDEQIVPDGDFPTLKFPNPEYKEALQLGINKLVKSGSDLLLATDPDADRMGVVVMHAGSPVILTGNEMAALCVDYLCEVMTQLGTLPKRGAFVTTIVTTELLKKIASCYQLPCFEVLTGFKYIGEKIHLWETSPDGYQFIFGAEESYGCLLGTHARDKDAIIAACLAAEIALYAKREGKTLIDRLHRIYNRFGLYREQQKSLAFPPTKAGMEAMAALMHSLRSKMPRTLGGQAVVLVEDYLSRKRIGIEKGTTEALDLPISDVLLFRLQDQSKVIIRPSGTEPKVKIYASVSQEKFPSISEGLACCDKRLDQLLKNLEDELR